MLFHPRRLIRVEGLLVGAGAAAAYFLSEYSVLLFVALILVPDLSMAGYLIDSRWGAGLYNVVHTYVGPALLGVGGWYVGVDLATAAALVWTVHIAVDRLFGFGLKYADREFADTHIQQT